MMHELKTLSEYFKAIERDEKTFEVRKNDRDFKVGDILLLCEIEQETNNITHNTSSATNIIIYTGNEITAKVTYILNDRNYCKDGYVILGFKKCNVSVCRKKASNE